jgi:hypothetical protein
MMAVHKATRSKSPTQTRRQHAKTARAAHENRADYQVKAEFFETLRHLNRGYGVALATLDKLAIKDRLSGRRIFPAGFLQDYRNRTESLRAIANHDVLLLVAGREREEASRFSRLSGQPAKLNR